MTYKGVDVQIHVFLTSASVGSEWKSSRPDHLTPGERAPPGTHLMGCSLGPRTGVDDMKKRKFFPLPELELQPLGHLAHS
jgi:hypothetical protein